MPGHRKRRQFKQTDAFTRGMVIGLKRAGWSMRQIAADTHLGASTVHRLWRRWLEQGNVAIYRNVGATRVTSARVDRRILRQAVAAPQATCTAILQHVQDTLDHSISTRTISRRLVANGLHSCRPLRRLPLTPPNRRQRLEWCRARSTWMTEWHRVVFTDESRFYLSSDSRRVRVWRRRGERSNPAAIGERPTVRQRGIMVWGAIAYDSRSPLLRIQGTMTAQRYVDDVLRPVTLTYLQGVPNALYQQDNARPHTARISQQALQDVQMLPWPPYSPDLSPIEHVWDIIGRRLHALPQPRSEDELWQMSYYLNPDIQVKRYNFLLSMRVTWSVSGQIQEPTDKYVLYIVQTISRRLVANGLHSCRPLRRLPLTPPNRRQSLEWCRARSTWMTEWHRVVFSDESRFCLSSDSRRVRVWRRRGERSNPAAIVERPTVRQRGIMVWGAIAYDSRSPLLRIQGTMTAQRYVDDVLRPVTLPYLQGVPNALYQQDNARPHTARIRQQALQDVQMLPWPPYSPDLLPIEHVWDIIGRRLHALPQPRSEDELWQMVEREWRAIPQDAIRTLIDSLPRRVAACIAVRGGPTCY
ncbi:Transposase [Cordylochernes scorpioides]|uniref:Transposase n=1 Tax=Cordylochernes scorpioides TaxID=51811 RepID=A0ABY6KNA4_9ARAC|nr:Transposase [Cordylochernes scorpioides]